MPSLFFSLLLVDLQIEVLYVWLNGGRNGDSLLQALSSMNIACSTSTRAAFRSLASQLPPFGDKMFEIGWNSRQMEKHIAGCMLWLSSRKVPLNTLMLGWPFSSNRNCGLEQLNQQGPPAFTLPHVTTVDWRQSDGVSNQTAKNVLRCCPNLTALRFERCITFTPSILAQLPKLTCLIVTCTVCNEQSFDALTLIGPRLRELRLQNMLSENLAKLIANCQELRTLKVSVNVAALTLLFQLLQSLQHLSALVLLNPAGMGFTDSQIAEIISMPRIMGLAVHDQIPVSRVCASFATMLELRPDLEFLYVGRCKYNAIERTMLLSTNSLDAAVMTRIIKVCPPVDVLRLIGACVGSEVAVAIATGWSHLRSLCIGLPQSAAFELVLQNCGPMLPLVTSLWLEEADKQEGTKDDILVDLVQCCPRLRDLSLLNLRNITIKALQDMLNRNVHLERLQIRCDRAIADEVQAKDVEWYRDQAQKQQMLPAPTSITRFGMDFHFHYDMI